MPRPVSDAAQSGSGSRSWELVGFGVVILVLTSYFAYALLWGVVRQRQSADFTPVAATVLASSVVESSTRTGTTSGSVSQFRPHIVYAYTVAGVRYERDHYHFVGPGWDDREDALATVARFSVGDTVTAYYDPRDPGVAVLDNARHPVPYPWAATLLVIGVIAVLALHRGWKRRG